MGSHYKRALLEENVMQIIKEWHSEVKKKKKKNKNMVATADIENSPRQYYSFTTAAAVSPSASSSPETSHINRSPTLARAAAAEADDEITEEWRSDPQ